MASSPTSDGACMTDGLSCDALSFGEQSQEESSNGTLSSKRARGEEEEEEGNNKISNKRHKKKDPADDLICPITRELPWVPVIAADGRTYEEEAIKTHFETLREKNLPIKSPFTNKLMADTLVPVPHIRSLIETLIENESIHGNVVETWNRKVQEQKAKEELLQKANSGDGRAMYKLAASHNTGSGGFKKDAKAAFEWCKKAHDAKHVPGTALLGNMLVRGSRVGVQNSTSNKMLGSVHLARAAMDGSNYAAFCLGFGLANGLHGFAQDKKEAIFWLRKSLKKCSCDHMTKKGKDRARALLDKLQSSNNESSSEVNSESNSPESD